MGGCEKDKWTKKGRKTQKKKSERDADASDSESDTVVSDMHGGAYVRVPWLRSDLFIFSKNFPKLTEEPEKWYTEVERIVTISKVLCMDLNTLFEIIVPRDVWNGCKSVVSSSAFENKGSLKAYKLV